MTPLEQSHDDLQTTLRMAERELRKANGRRPKTPLLITIHEVLKEARALRQDGPGLQLVRRNAGSATGEPTRKRNSASALRP